MFRATMVRDMGRKKKRLGPEVPAIRRMYDPETGARQPSGLRDPFFDEYAYGTAYALASDRFWVPLSAEEYYKRLEEKDVSELQTQRVEPCAGEDQAQRQKDR